jgi:hypothetical protein
MKTTTFDLMKMQAIELAVCKEFECRICDLVNVTDTFQKKVAVYILMHQGFDKRFIGHKYQMTYLYIPTVVAETELMMKVVPGFNDKINKILNEIDYDTTVLDRSRSGNFETALS